MQEKIEALKKAKLMNEFKKVIANFLREYPFDDSCQAVIQVLYTVFLSSTSAAGIPFEDVLKDIQNTGKEIYRIMEE